MIRRILVIAGFAAIFALSCKNQGAAPTGEGGAPVVKNFCKVNNQCWICPDEAAMKKCILNPATSGCKQGSAGDCP